MAIQIQTADGSGDIIEEIRSSILESIPDARVDVQLGGPGHFEIRVTSPVFEGKNRVKQQQLVYGAITHLMSGSSPPVHAVDRLECLVP
jgi:acid stress-induced BolA-like protein IbaG/YrbA